MRSIKTSAFTQKKHENKVIANATSSIYAKETFKNKT